MAYIEWQDFMAVGVPLVDADHKLMVNLVNQVHTCIGGKDEAVTLSSVLKALDDYTDFHFQREEKLQEHVGYPGVPEHKVQHARLLAEIRDVVRRIQAGQGKVRAADIQDFLEAWLMEHILNDDMAFSRYAVGKEGAEQAALAVAVGQARGRPPAGRFDWSRVSLLVVDDNRNVLNLLDTVLTGFGVGRVVTAAGWEEARELMAGQPFDALLLDLGGDGAVTAFIRGVRQKAPKTILLGLSDDLSVRSDHRELVEAVLEKPLSPRELLLTLSRLIEARKKG